jgi:hypothetical protein
MNVRYLQAHAHQLSHVSEHTSTRYRLVGAKTSTQGC